MEDVEIVVAIFEVEVHNDDGEVEAVARGGGDCPCAVKEACVFFGEAIFYISKRLAESYNA